MNRSAKWFQFSLTITRVVSIFFGTWPLFSEEKHFDVNYYQSSMLLFYWLKVCHFDFTSHLIHLGRQINNSVNFLMNVVRILCLQIGTLILSHFSPNIGGEDIFY